MDNNEKTKQLIQKRNRLIKDLNKEVETLKQLLETTNIMYIDTTTIFDNIIDTKRIIRSTQSDINIWSEK